MAELYRSLTLGELLTMTPEELREEYRRLLQHHIDETTELRNRLTYLVGPVGGGGGSRD